MKQTLAPELMPTPEQLEKSRKGITRGIEKGYAEGQAFIQAHDLRNENVSQEVLQRQSDLMTETTAEKVGFVFAVGEALSKAGDDPRAAVLLIKDITGAVFAYRTAKFLEAKMAAALPVAGAA
jgi:hypothetical protein